MRNKKNIFIIIIIIVSSLCHCSYATSSINSSAQQPVVDQSEPQVFAESAILLDYDANKILYEKNSKKEMYPASTTKLLTAVLAVEKCSDLSQKATVSYYAVHTVPYSYSIANLQPGEQISIKDLLSTLLIQSANESAYVLAEYIANNGNNYSTGSSESSKVAFEKSISVFSDMMNQKAKELGCENSNFVNPNGVHNEKHYTSAYDLMLIGKQAYSDSTIRSICKSTEYSLENTSIYTGEKRAFKTTNLLLLSERKGFYKYANGLKTGYTDAAQSCIIASAQKDDRNLIAVVLHSDDEADDNASRESDCKRLFEYGFNHFSNEILRNKDDIVQELSIFNATKETRSLNALCLNELKTLVITGEPLNITPEISINKTLAPISKGEVIGTISYTVNGETLSSDLIADHDVYPINYALIIIVLALIIIVILFIWISLGKRNKKRYKSKK